MRRALLSATLGLACSACGGGGGQASTTPVTVTLLSADALDGTVGAAGDFSTTGPVVQAGDGMTNEGYRAFVSFDIGSIPPSATVLTATLRLTQKQVMGAPYATMGSVVVDEVVFGNVLESGAYSRSFPVNQAFATLSSDALLEAKSVDATAVVRGDLANLRTQSQFRLRFTLESDNDGQFDLANFASGDSGNPTSERPTLIVTYHP